MSYHSCTGVPGLTAGTHGNGNDGAALEGHIRRLEEGILRAAVQDTGGLVQDQANGSPQYGTCQAQELTMASTQVDPSVTNHRF